MKTKPLHNAQTQRTNFFYARHMQPGTCRYDDEMILVDTPALKQLATTGAGVPVYVLHQPNVPIDEQKQLADGYVTDSFYNELDGWLWFKFMAIDDEARTAIANGWAVSNAYRPVQAGAGGTKNNVPFDREILSGEFTHLALVPNPRYENARIFTPDEFRAYQDKLKAELAELTNSKPSIPTKGISTMFKFFRSKREEVSNAGEATHVELEDGKIVTVAEAALLMNGKGTKKNEGVVIKDASEEMENETFDVDGEKIKREDMVNAWKKMKKNEADEAKKAEDEKKNAEEAERKAAEEKKNAEEEEKEKKKKEDEEKEKENARNKGFFDELANAHTIAKDAVVTIETPMGQTARGKARYGSAA